MGIGYWAGSRGSFHREGLLAGRQVEFGGTILRRVISRSSGALGVWCIGRRYSTHLDPKVFWSEKY